MLDREDYLEMERGKPSDFGFGGFVAAITIISAIFYCAFH